MSSMFDNNNKYADCLEFNILSNSVYLLEILAAHDGSIITTAFHALLSLRDA